MELVEGRPLDEVLRGRSPSQQGQLMSKARENLDQEFHQRGMRHGDPHIGNFIVSPNGQKVTAIDLGHAAPLNQPLSGIQPRFQVNNRHLPDARRDIAHLDASFNGRLGGGPDERTVNVPTSE
jgi:serine/threonine protein kinase